MASADHKPQHYWSVGSSWQRVETCRTVYEGHLKKLWESLPKIIQDVLNKSGHNK